MRPEPHPTGAGARFDSMAGPRHGASSSTLILISLGVLSLFLYLSFALATTGKPLILPLFPFRKGVIPGFLVHFYLLFALYLGSVWSVFRWRGGGRVVVITLLGFLVGFRLTLLCPPP